VANFLKDQRSATKDIKENGRLVTLLSPKASTPTASKRSSHGFNQDYSSGAPSSDGLYDETQISVVQTSFDSEMVDGVKIRQTDLRLLASGALTISSSHKIKDGNRTYDILNIETVRPSNIIILYKLQVR